ncbi:MAG: hypothetical protein LAT57_00095 [Balneolales bacterium]|nr:hypothetical protein [Balneolales bacterium]
MSAIVNDTLRIAPDKVRQLIAQWNRFNQRIYLQAQLGREETSFAEFFNGIVGYPGRWETVLEPGRKPATSIEAYRGMIFDDIDLRAIIGDTPLNYFPLSLLKNGSSFQANNPDRFDISTCRGSSFYKITSLYLFAPYVNFLGCLFEDSHFKFPHMYQAKLTACTLESCIFDQSYWNDNGSNGAVVEWRNVVIRKCKFQSPVMTKIKFVSSTIIESDLSGGNFRHYDQGEDAVTPILRKSRFDSSSWQIRTGLIGKIVECDFQNSIFYDRNQISGYIIANNFSYCQFQGETRFNYFCQYNDFRNTFFMQQPIFEEFCNLQGCDFTNSDISKYWSKEEFRQMLGTRVDSTTIWVDGTTF